MFKGLNKQPICKQPVSLCGLENFYVQSLYSSEKKNRNLTQVHLWAPLCTNFKKHKAVWKAFIYIYIYLHLFFTLKLNCTKNYCILLIKHVKQVTKLDTNFTQLPLTFPVSQMSFYWRRKGQESTKLLSPWQWLKGIYCNTQGCFQHSRAPLSDVSWHTCLCA